MCIAIIFIFFITNTAFCQSKIPVAADSISVKDTANITSALKLSDSAKKSNITDSSAIGRVEKMLGIKISKDALPSVVKADAEDSAVMDMKTNVSRLYGKVQVNYEDMQVNHGQILFDQGSNKVSCCTICRPRQRHRLIEKGLFYPGKREVHLRLYAIQL